MFPLPNALIVEKKTDVRKSLALELLKNSEPILESDSLYQAYMKILDFSGGMTDNAAAKMARDFVRSGNTRLAVGAGLESFSNSYACNVWRKIV